MSPFTPKGERARWRIIYDLLRKLSVGDVLTYDDIAKALELDAQKDRHTIQVSMRRAAKEYEAEDNRALEAVSNVGYRVVEAVEHLRLARGHQKRASRALARGHSKVVHVDFNQIDLESRKAFEVMAQAFAAQMDFNARLARRQRRLEDTVSDMSARSNRTEKEVDELRLRLLRLEQEMNRPSDPE